MFYEADVVVLRRFHGPHKERDVCPLTVREPSVWSTMIVQIF